MYNYIHTNNTHTKQNVFTKIRNYLYSIQITHREEEMGRGKISGLLTFL